MSGPFPWQEDPWEDPVPPHESHLWDTPAPPPSPRPPDNQEEEEET